MREGKSTSLPPFFSTLPCSLPLSKTTTNQNTLSIYKCNSKRVNIKVQNKLSSSEYVQCFVLTMDYFLTPLWIINIGGSVCLYVYAHKFIPKKIISISCTYFSDRRCIFFLEFKRIKTKTSIDASMNSNTGTSSCVSNLMN